MPEPGDDEGTSSENSTTQPLARRPLSEPHPARMSPHDPAYLLVIRAHDEALRSERETYIDPSSGLVVLTARSLARRGVCCESGCRHCPYLS